MARVFIGIPTLNRPRYVRETIASVLAQTCRNFRVIVSDNASEPAAASSVRDYVKALGDARFSFHQQGRNVGEYGQGRYFMSQVTEPYFVMLHDDDLMKPEYLAKAIAKLDEAPALACFVANPYAMNERGQRSEEKTRAYLSFHARDRRTAGEIDVLSTLLASGFTPCCGTCFRTSALRESGFVDADCQGIYPFEFNVLIRLGERGARAWFSPEEMLGFRFHGGSMTNYMALLDNPQVVGTMIRILERRRFSGSNERRRRAILGRLYRAQGLIELRRGDAAACRAAMWRALWTNRRSARNWLLAPGAVLTPWLIRRFLHPLPQTRAAPRITDELVPSASVLRTH